VFLLKRREPEDLVKWLHYSFPADPERVARLRSALQSWTSLRDRQPLERFCAAHQAQWWRDQELATSDVEPSALQPLFAHAAALGCDPDEVRARAAALGARTSRLLYEKVLEFPKRLARYLDFKGRDAPSFLLELELGWLRETLALEPVIPTEGEVDPRCAELELERLFESAVEIAVKDPWARDVGLGRFYELAPLEFVTAVAVPLVDPEWPVHFENLAPGEAVGGQIFVVEGSAALQQLRAFEPEEQQLRALAADRVAAALEEEGVKLDEELPEDGDYEEHRRDGAERRSPERVLAALRQLRARWQELKAARMSALEEVAAGRAVLLEWDERNPAY
jgi:hypothetical protein